MHRRFSDLMVNRIFGIEGSQDVGVGAIECIYPGLDQLTRLHAL
jgi:hypothetical protein